MHFHTEVVISETGKPEELIAEIMEDIQDLLGWDYWLIGGRWTNIHTESRADGELRELIRHRMPFLGEKEDAFERAFKEYFPHLPMASCGEEEHVAEDIVHVRDCPPWLDCYTLVLPGMPQRELHKLSKAISRKPEEWGDHVILKAQTWDERRRGMRSVWDGHVFPVLQTAGITHGRLVTVDYHS